MFKKFDVLENFLSGYFHQDIDLEYPVETGYIESVITTLIEEENEEYNSMIIQQINEFIEMDIDQNSKVDFILGNVEIVLDSQFNNPVDFLIYIRNSLENI